MISYYSIRLYRYYEPTRTEDLYPIRTEFFTCCAPRTRTRTRYQHELLIMWLWSVSQQMEGRLTQTHIVPVWCSETLNSMLYCCHLIVHFFHLSECYCVVASILFYFIVKCWYLFILLMSCYFLCWIGRYFCDFKFKD